jgi:hypothetical protein
VSEFTGVTMLRWSQERQVEWHYIAPGKPYAATAVARMLGEIT